MLTKAYNESKKSNFNIQKWQVPIYHRVVDFAALGEVKKTGLPLEKLKEIGAKITSIPSSFKAHPSIQKIYEARAKAIETG